MTALRRCMSTDAKRQVVLDLHLLRNRQGVVDFDPEIPDGTFQLPVTEKQLACSKVASVLVDQRHLRSA